MNFTWQEFATSKYNNKYLIQVKRNKDSGKLRKLYTKNRPGCYYRITLSVLNNPCMYLPSPNRSEKRCHLLIVLKPQTRQMAASRTRVTAEQTRTHPEVSLGNKTFLSHQRERSILKMEPRASIFK